MAGELQSAWPSKRKIEDLLFSYSPAVVARGRQYVTEGRVEVIPDDDLVRARVTGTKRYDVSLMEDGYALAGHCNCPAYDRDGECKHVAAVALAISAGTAGSHPDALPNVFARVYPAARFFPRLSLYAQKRIDVAIENWMPLQEWWGRSRKPRNAKERAAREALLASMKEHAAEVEADIAKLERWEPPKRKTQGTAFWDIYGMLAKLYRARRDDVRINHALPGPTDVRHPGFAFSYDGRRKIFEAKERAAPLLDAPKRLAFVVPLDGKAQVTFDGHALGGYASTDAWELFALKEILTALHEGTDDAVRAMDRELGRPLWDHWLERLSKGADPTTEPREWAFVVSSAYDGLRLAAFARRAEASTKSAKWKKQKFEDLLDEAVSPLETDIARAAVGSVDRSTSARIQLGTAQAHELLRLLANHPRVVFSPNETRDPLSCEPLTVVVGNMAMRLEPAEGDVLTPRFRIGDVDVDLDYLKPASYTSPSFRAGFDDNRILSAYIAPALRPWLSIAETMTQRFEFPPEAIPKLATATEKLVSAGLAELPREAMGAELPYEPAAALRIEWKPEGGAVVEVLVAVHPQAPLIDPGHGPTLFTFVDGERRVFVERDLASERKLVERTIEAITLPLEWSDGIGRTEGIEQAILLAEYLDRNPLGLAIELKVGSAPNVVRWGDANRNLQVSKQGSWLVLDGEIDVASVKLTIGDVLEAARLARRYVRVEDGTFLELSKDVIDTLQPLAIATELAGSDADTLRLNDAFGAVLAGVAPVFSVLRGIDVVEYVRRFEGRDRRKIKVPSLDHGTLRKYQRDGVAWILGLATWAPGCVLADDMGLGKTVQTAAVLKARAELGPALIVAPASVSSNWLSELARFMPSLKVSWYNEERSCIPSELGANDVLVVSYGLLQRHVARFREQQWATVVLDEAQYVKNVSAQRTDAVRSLPRDFTIALTGTPLENHLGELFSIVDLAFPGLLGSDATFRDRFRRPIEVGRDGVKLGTLGRLIAPFLLRRTRAHVLRELPPRQEIAEYIDLAPDERKRYLALRKACEEQFAKRKRGETPAQLKIALLAALTRLRQLACDVSLVDPTHEGSSTKIARTVELVRQLADEGNAALVFSQFTQFLDKIRDALASAGLRVAYLAGDTPTTKRRAIIDAFQAGEYDVFCVSLLAGGTGLNLTRASYVIHTDPWWNPAVEEQATSRAHRMGQTAPVTVYRLVARGTIEQAVLEMHASKKELASAVLEGKESARAITQKELFELLRFGV